MRRSALVNTWLVLGCLLPGVSAAPAAAAVTRPPAPGPWILNWSEPWKLVATELAAPHRTKTVWQSNPDAFPNWPKSSVVVAPNGRIAAASSSDTGTRRGALWLSGGGLPTLRLYAPAAGRCVARAAFSRSGRYLAYVTGRQTERGECHATAAFVYDDSTRRTVRMAVTSAMHSVDMRATFSYDENYLEVGGFNMRVQRQFDRLYSRATGRRVSFSGRTDMSPRRLVAVASPRGTVAIASSDDFTLAYTINSTRRPRRLAEAMPSGVINAASSPNGSHVAYVVDKPDGLHLMIADRDWRNRVDKGWPNAQRWDSRLSWVGEGHVTVANRDAEGWFAPDVVAIATGRSVIQPAGEHGGWLR